MYKTILSFVTIALLVITSACSNSTSSDDHEHADAEGFRLKMNGDLIVEQLPGEDLTGMIELTSGEESDLIHVWFLDDDGHEFQPEDDEYSLGYQFTEDGIVEFEQHDGEKWEFHLHAEDVEDHTELTLKLLHGSHSDFTTQEIHVHVENE